MGILKIERREEFRGTKGVQNAHHVIFESGDGESHVDLRMGDGWEPALIDELSEVARHNGLTVSELKGRMLNGEKFHTGLD
jgi:hypothetical protein